MSILQNITIKQKLLEIIINDGCEEPDYEETIKWCVEDFQKMFPDYDINNLIFIYGLPEHDDDLYVFKLSYSSEKIIGFVADKWFELPVAVLSIINQHDEKYDVTLTKNSCDNITYELCRLYECISFPLELLVNCYNDDKVIHVEGQKYKTSEKIKEYMLNNNKHFIFSNDWDRYKRRISTENTFQKLKVFRRIQIRYDLFIDTYLGFLFLAISNKT